MSDPIHFAHTQYGFNWGSAKITRCCSDSKKGWVVFRVETPKQDIQICVTKTGKVRIADASGEWTKAKEAKP